MKSLRNSSVDQPHKPCQIPRTKSQVPNKHKSKNLKLFICNFKFENYLELDALDLEFKLYAQTL